MNSLPSYHPLCHLQHTQLHPCSEVVDYESLAGTLATVSCVVVTVAVDLFCREKEGIPTDVFDSSCREILTGKAAWNLPAVSNVVGSWLAARSRRFNTRRFTRMVARLNMVQSAHRRSEDITSKAS
jgi:hypothetical protein